MATHKTKHIISPAQLCEASPRGTPLTTWHNPSPHHVSVELYVDGPRSLASVGDAPRVTPPTFCLLTVPPGAEVDLPATFDNAIQQKSPDGRIVGSIAPQLRRKGDAKPRFAPGVEVRG